MSLLPSLKLAVVVVSESFGSDPSAPINISKWSRRRAAQVLSVCKGFRNLYTLHTYTYMYQTWKKVGNWLPSLRGLKSMQKAAKKHVKLAKSTQFKGKVGLNDK